MKENMYIRKSVKFIAVVMVSMFVAAILYSLAIWYHGEFLDPGKQYGTVWRSGDGNMEFVIADDRSSVNKGTFKSYDCTLNFEISFGINRDVFVYYYEEGESEYLFCEEGYAVCYGKDEFKYVIQNVAIFFGEGTYFDNVYDSPVGSKWMRVDDEIQFYRVSE